MTPRMLRILLAWTVATSLLAAPAWASLSPAPSSFCDSVSQIPRGECEVLLALYNQTTGRRWLWTTGWLQTSTPCDWFGVTCDGGHVAELVLTSNWLQGTLPTQMGDLPRLRVLDLAFNRLTGGIPTQLGALGSLQKLSLSDNQLTGPIPVQLANLPALEQLYLHSNRLSGHIPPELGNLANLQFLALYNNQLDGPIPPQLGDASQLFDLNLSSNHLTGGLPPEFGKLKRLERLFLQNNRLSGPLDPQLSGMTYLLKLRVENNALSGDIPSAIATMTRLGPRTFDTDLGYNMLYTTDPVVQHFFDLRDPGWTDTQTLTPGPLRTRWLSSSTMEISWPLAIYTEHGGRYEIGGADVPSGPYNIIGATADKATNAYVVDVATIVANRCLAVRTYTPPHGLQQNALASDFSEPVCLALRSLFCPKVGR